ncbi:MAG: type II toxin-antitoxin system HipA family toxin [Thermodesulfobacteriota bacterium]
MGSGYKELDVRFRQNPRSSFSVGTLAEKDGDLFFEYDSEWIDGGLQLSPFTLPLQHGLIAHRDRRFGPIFGLFDDSLPDGWGLLLMDRFFRGRRIDPASLSILDRLAYLGSMTMGALTYYPPAGQGNCSGSFDLDRIAREAVEVFSGKEEEILPQLMRAGGSPGGARPKVVVGYNSDTGDIISGEGDLAGGYEHWIVKFSSYEDMEDAGPVEYGYGLMAESAGIKMEKMRLFTTSDGRQFFGVKRFDRAEGNNRIHNHTLGGLIHADFRIPGCDYGDLLKVTTLLTKNYLDLKQAFRLMCFNVLAYNRDDHVKNFSFMLDRKSGQWSLAPAYDLTFAEGPAGEHTTTILGEGKNPDRSHCLQLAEQAGIRKETAEQIFSEVRKSVARWPDFAEQAGVRQAAAREIVSFLKC